MARQEATVFPRLVTPRGLAALWLLLASVMAAGLAILSIETPAYSPASVIAVVRNGSGSGEAVLVALAPGKQPNVFHPGNAAIVELTNNRPPVTGSIIEVEKAQISLQEAAARFGLPTGALSAIRFPTSVVLVHPTADVGDLLRSVNRNVIYQAQIQSGKRRAISYVISAATHE